MNGIPAWGKRGLSPLFTAWPVPIYTVMLFFIAISVAAPLQAATRFARATGTWSAAGTWSNVSCAAVAGGGIPAAGDDVTICATRTVTLNANSASLNSLTVAGTLTIGSNATGRTLTVAGNISVSGTMSTGATAATHSLIAGGDITNTGTINLRPTATRVCNVTFNKNGNQTVSGAGAYTFNRITLNMGATNANVLDMQSAMTVPSPFLTITNGTYKHSNTSNITPWTAAVTIPASGGFWLNGAATVTTTGFNVSVTGLFRISAGTMTIGNANTTRLILNNASTFQMDGGALTVTGGLGSAAVGSTGTFTMSGGTINVQTISAGTPTSFILGSGTTFNMSGGTIVLVNGDNATWDMDVRSGTQNISGGTVQIGSGATTAANNFAIANGGGGTLRLWNLTHAAGVARSNTLGSAVNVLNSLTIQANNTLIGGGFAINVGDATGNAIPGIGNWTNNGAYTTGTSTVSFVGPGAATLGGSVATTFQNLTINKAAATNTVTINSASAALSPTVNGILNLTSGHVFTTVGTNDLGLGTAGTVSGGSTASHVAGAVQKNYAAAGTLTFPVGDGTNYTPVVIAGTAGFTAGSLTISTTGSDHPSIALSGINSANSVNRYWTMTPVGVPATSVFNATFNYINGSPVDLDNPGSVGSYVIEQWDGSTWFPTTLNAACTTTQCRINGETGFGDFAIGAPLSGFNPNPGAFNAFETTASTTQVLGRIFSKLAGTGFTLSIVAVSNNARNAAPSTNQLTVEIMNSSGTPGTFSAATNCWSGWTSVQSQTVAAPVGWTSGRVNVTINAPTQAVRDARIRVTQAGTGLIGCSTDRFSIRPAAFTIGSSANNNNSSGAPAIKTGANFSITAQPLRSDLATSITIGYDGTPSIDNTKVVNTPNAGAIGGGFSAATGGAATGSGFFYSEVGNFGLNANAIFDSAFTAVDQPNDCTADFSNTLVGGKYGCSFGSIAIARTVGTSGFGRFIPDNFLVTFNAPQFATACAAGTFTYVGQTFIYGTAPVMTVTARNGTNNGLTNAPTGDYAGSYMKLSNTSGTSLNQAPYDTQGGRYTRFDALGGGTTPALDTSGLPATTVDPVIGTFSAGQGTLTFGSGTGLAFSRSTTTPNAPFNADIALALNVIDADGVTFAGNPASFGTATAGNGIAFNSGNAFRYGRLRMQNANGSELLNLPVNLALQYWAGAATGWQTNTLDTCTAIAAANFAFSFPANPGNLLAACETAVSVGGSAPNYTISLAKPGAGNAGWTDLTLNLGATASGNQCTVVGGPGGPATTANAPWLQYNWTGTVGNPAARATFGVYKSGPVIHRREMY